MKRLFKSVLLFSIVVVNITVGYPVEVADYNHQIIRNIESADKGNFNDAYKGFYDLYEAYKNTDSIKAYRALFLACLALQYSGNHELVYKLIRLNQDLLPSEMKRDFMFLRADSLYKNRQYESSNDDINQCLLFNIDDCSALLLQAKNYYCLKNLDKSIRSIERINELNRNFKDSRMVLATVYYDQGKYIDALYQLNIYFENKEKDYNMLGLVAQKAGLFHKANEYYKEYLKKHPDDLTARYNLALVLWDTGNESEARKILLKIKSENNKKYSSIIDELLKS